MTYPIPNNYREKKKGQPSKPAYLIGFEHYWYANTDEILEDTDFDDWTVSLFDRHGNEVSLGVPVEDIIDTGFRFHITFTIPAGTPPGEYVLAVYNTVTSEVKFQTNCIDVITEEQALKYVLIEYKNSTDIFNINHSLDEYLSVFMPLNLIEAQPEIGLKQSKEESSGVIRTQKIDTAKVLRLEAYYLDDAGHDFMMALSVHDDVKINGKIVELKTGYQVSANPRMLGEKGVIEYYDQAYSTVNYKN